MKKGDIVRKETLTPAGVGLGNVYDSPAQAEAQFEFFRHQYKIQPHVVLSTVPDPRFDGTFSIAISEDWIEAQEAKVNWVVGDEFALEFPNGGCSILDTKEPDGQGWVVIHEASPEYQDSVEHMTDDQLRASIDELRMRRISQPPRVKITKVSAPKLTEEDKLLSGVLKKMSPEAMIELQRKLGLID